MSAIDTEILEKHINNMWLDYLNLTTDAKPIYDMFCNLNKQVINDHIALRTFNVDIVNIDKLAEPFIKHGYQYVDSYIFPQKKLSAKYFIHKNPLLPKIFISELKIEELSSTSKKIINNLVKQIDSSNINKLNFCYSGRPWNITKDEYLTLDKESEYASWVAAHGYRPNHFTILVNSLQSHTNLQKLNEFLLSNGFKLNTFGGAIKGSPQQLLEQSSTMAKKIQVTFNDMVMDIPGCYYEFALRYQQADGKLYQGFVASSADKIFESTTK